MLRTNLSTRPFYNQRPVYVALLVAALVVGVLTVFNIAQLTRLSSRSAALGVRVQEDETRAARLRQDAARARASINREQLEAVLTASREANHLIDGRVFSWTELLNRLETTLPPDVRIQTIRPQVSDEGFGITMAVVARRPEDVEEFIDNLEATGAFRNMFSRSETTNPEGLLEVLLEGQYQGRAAAPPPPARK